MITAAFEYKIALWLLQIGASSGLRYKFGRNLNTNQKNALIIKDPKIYKLPYYGHQPSYLIANMIIISFIPMKHLSTNQNLIILFSMEVLCTEEIPVSLAIMKEETVIFNCESVEETQDLAKKLAKNINPGITISLIGDLLGKQPLRKVLLGK